MQLGILFYFFKLNDVIECRIMGDTNDRWWPLNVPRNHFRNNSHVFFSGSILICMVHNAYAHALVVPCVFRQPSNSKWNWVRSVSLYNVHIEMKAKLFHIILTRRIFFAVSFSLKNERKKEKWSNNREVENLAIQQFRESLPVPSSSQP